MFRPITASTYRPLHSSIASNSSKLLSSTARRRLSPRSSRRLSSTAPQREDLTTSRQPRPEAVNFASSHPTEHSSKRLDESHTRPEIPVKPLASDAVDSTHNSAQDKSLPEQQGESIPARSESDTSSPKLEPPTSAPYTASASLLFPADFITVRGRTFKYKEWLGVNDYERFVGPLYSRGWEIIFKPRGEKRTALLKREFGFTTFENCMQFMNDSKEITELEQHNLESITLSGLKSTATVLLQTENAKPDFWYASRTATIRDAVVTSQEAPGITRRDVRIAMALEGMFHEKYVVPGMGYAYKAGFAKNLPPTRQSYIRMLRKTNYTGVRLSGRFGEPMIPDVVIEDEEKEKEGEEEDRELYDAMTRWAGY